MDKSSRLFERFSKSAIDPNFGYLRFQSVERELKESHRKSFTTRLAVENSIPATMYQDMYTNYTQNMKRISDGMHQYMRQSELTDDGKDFFKHLIHYYEQFLAENERYQYHLIQASKEAEENAIMAKSSQAEYDRISKSDTWMLLMFGGVVLFGIILAIAESNFNLY